MLKGKFLHTTKINDYKYKGFDVEFSVYGVFDTESVSWKYYVVSHISSNNDVYLTPDICHYETKGTIDNVRNQGKKVATKEDGIAYIQNFKEKWEYGSNDTRQEKRDKNINDILDGTES